jgi:hypothetical protein
LNGSAVIGSGALNNGVATLTISTLPLGAQSIKAAYSGTASYGTSASATLTETVAPDPDFTLTTTGASVLAIVPGSTASFGFLVTPQPSPFTGAIALAVTGLPAGATASFTPSSVTPSGTPIAFTMTVKTAPLAVLLNHGSRIGGSLALTLLFLPWLNAGRRKVIGRSARLASTVLACLGIGSLLALLGGCGSANGFFGQAPQTYTLTVTGTSTNAAGATITHSTTVNLTLQ